MSSSLTVHQESTSIQSHHVTIQDEDGDPTGQTVEFQLSALTVTDPPGSWTAGTWHSDGYNATTQRATAITPTIGGSGAGIEAAEGNYRLWIRWGTVVKSATLIVT